MNTVWGWLKGFGRFWYDFIVGDDWTIAAGVCLALGGTYGLLRANVAAWWLTPVAAVAIVAFAVRRANGREAAADAAEEDADEPVAREQVAEREPLETR
jgi:hypothetical protein